MRAAVRSRCAAQGLLFLSATSVPADSVSVADADAVPTIAEQRVPTGRQGGCSSPRCPTDSGGASVVIPATQRPGKAH